MRGPENDLLPEFGFVDDARCRRATSRPASNLECDASPAARRRHRYRAASVSSALPRTQTLACSTDRPMSAELWVLAAPGSLGLPRHWPCRYSSFSFVWTWRAPPPALAFSARDRAAARARRGRDRCADRHSLWVSDPAAYAAGKAAALCCGAHRLWQSLSTDVALEGDGEIREGLQKIGWSSSRRRSARPARSCHSSQPSRSAWASYEQP